ncbi:hypothetical protein AFLA_007618 [Aspergillus flavus NRRL3357]|nr:hypothetical protein AFLA_007618 [Aspergillus flavus NRRL3357]
MLELSWSREAPQPPLASSDASGPVHADRNLRSSLYRSGELLLSLRARPPFLLSVLDTLSPLESTPILLILPSSLLSYAQVVVLRSYRALYRPSRAPPAQGRHRAKSPGTGWSRNLMRLQSLSL